MKIKETEIKNSQAHAPVVYINPLVGGRG